MTLVKYTGHAHIRDFVKGDFTRHGVDDQGAVKFNEANNWVEDVSDDAAEFLKATDEFRDATEDDKTAEDLTRPGTTPKRLDWRSRAADAPPSHTSVGSGGESDAGETTTGGPSRSGRASRSS